jgi:hypothetical protein
MKTFQEFQALNESVELPKNTMIRPESQKYTRSVEGVPTQYHDDIIGYFQWTGVMDERIVTKLTKEDIAWFKQQNVPTKNVLRYYTNKGTNLFMLDVKKGKVKWFDTAAYEETDKITFEPRFYKYKSLLIDNTPEAKSLFGVNDIVEKPRDYDFDVINTINDFDGLKAFELAKKRQYIKFDQLEEILARLVAKKLIVKNVNDSYSLTKQGRDSIPF